jgi:hypothetical protein
MLHRIASSARRPTEGAWGDLNPLGFLRNSAAIFCRKLIRGCSPQIQNRVVTDLLKVGTDLHAVGTGPSEVVTDLLKVGTDFIEAVPTSLKVGTD